MENYIKECEEFREMRKRKKLAIEAQIAELQAKLKQM